MSSLANCITELTKLWFTNDCKVNVFSFFAGAGFLDLGFELADGFNIVYVSEYHKPFNDIYRYSRKHMNLPVPKYGHHVEDVSTLLENPDRLRIKELVDKSQKEAITGFIGGPPCPDFSVAGKNRGENGDNGKLSRVYVDLICANNPDFFLFENVKGLYRTARHRLFFEQLKDQLRNNGYCLTEQLLNALEFGVPQDRDRIIMIGIHRRLVKKASLPVNGSVLQGFPWDKYKIYNLTDVLSRPWPDQDPYLPDVHGRPAPDGIIPELTIQHWWDQNDVSHHPNAGMFFTPKAGLFRFQTKDEGDVEKKCYKRLHRNRYSPTAAYGNNEVHVHPYEPRRISVAEALAIQSLPASFQIPNDVTLSDAFKTIGNGVPFLLARGIAQSLYDYINKKI